MCKKISKEEHNKFNLKKIIIDFIEENVSLRNQIMFVLNEVGSSEFDSYLIDEDSGNIVIDINAIKCCFYEIKNWNVDNMDYSSIYLGELFDLFENFERQLETKDKNLCYKINNMYAIEQGYEDRIEELMVDGVLTKDEIDFLIEYSKTLNSSNMIKVLTDDYNPKPRTIYKVDCEWDIGQDNISFVSEAKAMEWVENNSTLKDNFEDGDILEDLFEEGLVSIIPFDLIGD